MAHFCAGRGLRSIAMLVATAIVTAALGAATGMAAETRANSSRGAQKEAAATVEMFDGMKSGQLEVKLIARDSTQGNVMITNKTGKPLTVKLPKAFAGTPILAQRGGGGLGGGGGVGGGGMGGGMNQGVGGGMGGGMGGMGGGMGGMGGGMGGGGMGGGFMNIPAEKMGKIKVQLVCLEHGKPDPRASVPYEIKPIDSFTKDASVQQLCSMLGEGKLDQRVAQVAAWHLANNMSFDQLAAKQVEHLGSPPEPYFSQHEVRAAMAVAGHVTAQAALAEKDGKDNGKSTSPGKSLSDAKSDEPAFGTASAEAVIEQPVSRRKLRSR